MAASRGSPKTCEQVCRDEERPPALGLADVDVLMVTAHIEHELVDTEDDMAQGQRRGASFFQGRVTQKPRDRSAIDFDYPAPNLNAAPGE